MQTLAMSTKWEVIKGYLSNAALAGTYEDWTQPLSSGPGTEALSESDGVCVQTIRRWMWVMAASSISHWGWEKRWHVIKSDPDIAQTKSCPRVQTSAELPLV